MTVRVRYVYICNLLFTNKRRGFVLYRVHPFTTIRIAVRPNVNGTSATEDGGMQQRYWQQ